MHRYFGLAVLIVLGGLVYLIFTQLWSGVNLNMIFTNLQLPGFRSSSSTKVVPEPYKGPPPRYSQPTFTYLDLTPSQPVVRPPQGFSLSDLSPYYGKVRISSVNPGSFYSASQFSVNSYYGGEESIDISGWHFRNNKGNEVVIPQAVNVFSPALVPFLSDIIIEPNNYVYFFNSSIHGPNLRLNKCTGYLNAIYHYEPALPQNCPYIGRESISFLSGQCQNFIISLGSCEVPDLNKFYSSVRSDDTTCRSYIDNFSYRGCYARYSGDSDFVSNEWRVWLDSQLPLDPNHDRILLLDRSGLLVDLYSY